MQRRGKESQKEEGDVRQKEGREREGIGEGCEV